MVKKIIDQDSIELTDSMRHAIADMCNENINGIIEEICSDNFAIFDNADNPGEFYVFLGPENELKITLTLDRIIDVTVTVRENHVLLSGLADELERLASKVRSVAIKIAK